MFIMQKCHKTRNKVIICLAKCQQKEKQNDGTRFVIYLTNKGFRENQDSKKPKLRMWMFNLKYRRLNYDAY